MIPLAPLMKLGNPTIRKSREAGIDVIELALNHASPGERGFFTMLKPDTSSPDSLDAGKQQGIWEKSLEWANVTKNTTSLADLE